MKRGLTTSLTEHAGNSVAIANGELLASYWQGCKQEKLHSLCAHTHIATIAAENVIWQL